MSNHHNKLQSWGLEIEATTGYKFLKAKNLDLNPKKPSAELAFAKGNRVIVYETNPEEPHWINNLIKVAEHTVKGTSFPRIVIPVEAMR